MWHPDQSVTWEPLPDLAIILGNIDTEDEEEDENEDEDTNDGDEDNGDDGSDGFETEDDVQEEIYEGGMVAVTDDGDDDSDGFETEDDEQEEEEGKGGELGDICEIIEPIQKLSISENATTAITSQPVGSGASGGVCGCDEDDDEDDDSFFCSLPTAPSDHKFLHTVEHIHPKVFSCV
jgi:hypothetical protein